MRPSKKTVTLFEAAVIKRPMDRIRHETRMNERVVKINDIRPDRGMTLDEAIYSRHVSGYIRNSFVTQGSRVGRLTRKEGVNHTASENASKSLATSLCIVVIIDMLIPVVH